MPWSNKTKGLPRFLANEKKIRLKAQKLHELKIKRLLKPDGDKFNGIISFQIITAFSRETKIRVHVLLLILLMDFYKIFCKNDAWLWGIFPKDAKLTIAFKEAVDWGYIEKLPKTVSYYHTIKGRQLVERYNEFYKKTVKKILKSNANGNLDVKYANKSVCRKSPAVNTGSDQSEGIKYQRISERKDT